MRNQPKNQENNKNENLNKKETQAVESSKIASYREVIKQEIIDYMSGYSVGAYEYAKEKLFA